MNRKNKGFTVMELIIVMTLTVILICVIGTGVTITNNMILLSENKSTLQSEAEKLQQTISEFGMQAKDIEIIKDTEGNVKIVNIISYDDRKMKIELYGRTLKIENNKYSTNIESFNISPNNNWQDKTVFNINIDLKLGNYKNQVNYPVNITIRLRNKDK